MTQMNLTIEQALQLGSMARDRASDDAEQRSVLLTKQGLDGMLVIAFDDRTYEVSTAGTVEVI